MGHFYLTKNWILFSLPNFARCDLRCERHGSSSPPLARPPSPACPAEPAASRTCTPRASCASVRNAPGAAVAGRHGTYVFSSLYSNIWLLVFFGKLWEARSRLYRSQILQINTRWKALAEIYTMHSFAPFWNRIPKNEENHVAPFWNRIPKIRHRSLISIKSKIAEVFFWICTKNCTIYQNFAEYC